MRYSILTFSLAISLVACGQSGQSGPSGQSGKSVSVKDGEGKTRSVEVTESGSKRTVTSADGVIKAEGTQGGKNARFPAYAPQYPGATVQSVVDMNISTSVKQHIITQQTPDTPDKVIAFYKGKVDGTGKKSNEIQSETGLMLFIGGTSPVNMEASISAMPRPSGGTSVSIAVQERVGK